MMPKDAKRLSPTRIFGLDNIMLQPIGIDHVDDFESIRSEIIVI